MERADANGQPLDVPFVPYVEGGRAFLAGIEVTEQLRDCAKCPNCGVYGNKKLVGRRDCFRCRPRVAPARGGRKATPGLVLLLIGLLAGALVALLMR